MTCRRPVLRIDVSVVLACICFLLVPLHVHAGQCEAAMEEASRRYDVPLGILYSVGLTETGVKGELQPFALNIEGDPHIASTKQEALSVFRLGSQSGKKLIDLGCMQINHYYHHQNFPSVAEMLAPQKNVDYAARFLAQLYEAEQSWTLVVARYHAGRRNKTAQKRYICKVIANLEYSGFGRRTGSAKRYCG